MASDRRTAKKTGRKSNSGYPTSRRKSAVKRKSLSGILFVFLSKAMAPLSVVLVVIVGVYYFGGFETRQKFHELGIKVLNPIRTASWMPGFTADLLNGLYDTIPTSEGFVVDGSELGRNKLPLIAGIPQTKDPIRLLQNSAYVTIFNDQLRQAKVVAVRLDSIMKHEDIAEGVDVVADPRTSKLKMSALHLNEWQARPILPAEALAEAYGYAGIKEAALLSNHVPMKDTFYTGVWLPLIQKIADKYTKRFDEIWIYCGPAYKASAAKLVSGIPVPETMYVLVFDITDYGGLRGLALMVPTDASQDTPVSSYLSSIGEIQKATGIQFIPEISFDANDALLNWQSPNMW